MEEIYINTFIDILNRARENPGHSVSLEEICEIFLEELHRELIRDQAEMLDIHLDTVDIVPS